MPDIAKRRRFLLFLVKPSHYDDEGYVIQWWKSALPSNSLACLFGIAQKCMEDQVLGEDVDIEIFPVDETNFDQVVDLPAGYEVGQSLVCDTLEQVELFADLFSGDAQSAIRVVNEAEHNPSACGIVNVAFMRGDKHGMIRHSDSTFEIVHILVVGVETERGLRPVRPAAYFTLFEVTEYPA